MPFARLKLKRLDFPLLLATLGIVALGLILLYHFQSDEGAPQLFQRQLVYAFVGLLLMTGAALLSPRVHFGLAYVLYGVSCLVLFGVLVWGKVVHGAESWINLGLFTFQPSEPAKIGLILALSRLVTDKRFDLNRISHLLRAAALTVLPLGLVMAQPDLGTAIVFASIFFITMVAAGTPWFYLLILASPALAALTSFHAVTFLAFIIVLIALAWRMKMYLGLMAILLLGNLAISAATPYFWNQLKPYQQKRLTSFMDPEADPKGSGYQVIQSKVAVGSGGVLGKGLGKGTQSQLKFLPEQHTDFIFSVVGEELGMVGATGVLLLYGIIISRGFLLGMQSGGRYTGLVCAGLSAMLAVHVFINIGMAVGVMPVTGLPLPFLSYGGSFLWTSMTSVGFILGAKLRSGDYTP